MKSHTDDRSGTAHIEASESLPWLVSGTLDPVRAASVRSHLAECAECRERLAFDQALSESLRDEHTVDYAPHAGYAKFASRLDADEAPPRTWRSWTRGFPGFELAWRPRALHVLVAAQTAAIVMLAAGLVLEPRSVSAPKEYRGLSQARPAAGPGATVRLVVEDTMGTGQLHATLQQIHAQIVGGPSELGVLTIEADPTTGATYADALALARWLRAQPGVRFAEPVEGARQ
jgi:anti-sigma factor RsiW